MSRLLAARVLSQFHPGRAYCSDVTLSHEWRRGGADRRAPSGPALLSRRAGPMRFHGITPTRIRRYYPYLDGQNMSTVTVKQLRGLWSMCLG